MSKNAYLEAALPDQLGIWNFLWLSIYPKGMGLASLLIHSKSWCIMDPPSGGVIEHSGINIGDVVIVIVSNINVDNNLCQIEVSKMSKKTFFLKGFNKKKHSFKVDH